MMTAPQSWRCGVSRPESFLQSGHINYICVPTAEEVKTKIMSTIGRLVLQGQPALAQFWAAIKMGNTFVLTTTNQPFGLLGINEDLLAYHIACLDHKFYVYKNPKNLKKRVAFGLPARVFLSCSPEQTRDVHECPPDHRPPCEDAIFTKKWGSFALPVIVNGNYVGVLAFVTNTRSYERDIDEVYGALENAGLRSSNSIYRQEWTCIERKERQRQTLSVFTAKYNLLAQLFGLPKAHAARKLGHKDSTFGTVCQDVGILEWPALRNYQRALKTSSLEIVFEDFISDRGDEILEWLREQPMTTLATQTNQEAPLDFLPDVAAMEYECEGNNVTIMEDPYVFHDYNTFMYNMNFGLEEQFPEWSCEQPMTTLATRTNQEAPLNFMPNFASMEYPDGNMFMDNKESEWAEWINELSADNM